MPQNDKDLLPNIDAPLPQDDSLEADYIKRLQEEEFLEAKAFIEQKIGRKIGEPEKPSLEKPSEKGKEFETISGQVLANIADIPTGAASGVMSAALEFVESFDDLQSFIRSREGVEAKDLEVINTEALSKKFETETTGGAVAKSAAQFLTGFLPIFKASKLVKVGLQGVNKAKGLIPRAVLSGAVADALVFDPKADRISNLINNLSPKLRNPITEFIESSPDDTDAEGRLKGALEGLALGGTTEGIFMIAKVIRRAKFKKDVDVDKVQKNLATEAEKAEEGTIKQLQAETAEEVGKKAPPITIKKGTVQKAEELFKTDLPQEAITQRRFLGENININFDRIDTPEDVKMTMVKLIKVYQKEIEAWRGGTAVHEETIQLAKESRITLEDILALKPGDVLPRAEALAARHLEAFVAKELHQTLKQIKNPEDVQKVLKQLELFSRVAPRVRGLATEAGRTLEALKIGVDGNLIYAERVRGAIEEIDTGMSIQSIMAKLQSVESPEALEKIARKALRPGASDIFLEVWINGLLSNVTTQFVNFLSNVSVAIMAIPERFLAGQLHIGANPGVVSGEASALLFGMISGLNDGFRAFGRAFKTGVPSSELTKIEGQITPKITARNFELTGTLGRAVDLFGEVVRIPGRLLMSTDEFFKVVNYRGELHTRAFRQATQEGLTGGALGKRIAEIVADPPLALQKAASDFSHYQTFTNELGPIGKSVQSFTASHPAARLVLPFTRTPGNIFKFTLERTPLRLLQQQFWTDIKAGGAQRDLALGKLAFGSMVMATMATLARAGYLTGDGPSNPTLKKQMIDGGWQPNSIWIGDRWHSFNRLDPIGAYLGLAADFANIRESLDTVDGDKAALALVVSFANNMTSKTYLEGLSNAVNAIVEPKRAGGEFVKSLERSLIPSGIRQITRAVDNTRRETESLFDELKSGIPGWSKTLPPRRKKFGEVAREPFVNAFTPFQQAKPLQDPVYDELDRQEIGLGTPGRFIGGPAESQLGEKRVIQGVKLDPIQYDRRLVLAGNEAKDPATGLGLKDALAQLIQQDEYKALTDGPDGGKARIIRNLDSRYRELADAQLIQEFPDLQVKLARQKLKKAQALVGEENVSATEEDIIRSLSLQ